MIETTVGLADFIPSGGFYVSANPTGEDFSFIAVARDSELAGLAGEPFPENRLAAHNTGWVR